MPRIAKKTTHTKTINSVALLRISTTSIAYERPERLADVVSYHQIRDVILFRRLVVDDHQPGAAILRHERKTCGGPND